MKCTLVTSFAALCLFLGACSSGGSGATFDPSGDWALALLVTAGTGDGAGNVDSARLFTATIQPAASGGNAYDVLLEEAGGGSHALSAWVDGDQLRLSGTLLWIGPAPIGAANVVASSVTIRDKILFGTVEVELGAGASGSETWYLSAFDPATQGAPDSILALGWWQLDQEVVGATGSYTGTVGETSQTILFVGPEEIFKFVVAWWRSDGAWGGVTDAQGRDSFNLAGWSRQHDQLGLTWQETVVSFPVDAKPYKLDENVIQLASTGDKVGTQTLLYTGKRVLPGTVPGTPSPTWAERFVSWEPSSDK